MSAFWPPCLAFPSGATQSSVLCGYEHHPLLPSKHGSRDHCLQRRDEGGSSEHGPHRRGSLGSCLLRTACVSEDQGRAAVTASSLRAWHRSVLQVGSQETQRNLTCKKSCTRAFSRPTPLALSLSSPLPTCPPGVSAPNANGTFSSGRSLAGPLGIFAHGAPRPFLALLGSRRQNRSDLSVLKICLGTGTRG